MIVVIPQSDPLCNSHAEPDWEWLPRICPACGERAIIGNGRRRKQAHDERHTWICIRRGFCKRGNADRIPDACTLRGWFQQRIDALLCWLKLISPTLIFRSSTRADEKALRVAA